MLTCPAGHDSAGSDFCDVCGIRMGGTPAAASPVAPEAAPPQEPEAAVGQGPEPAADPCPRCGTGRSGQFCEVCGFDFESRSGPAGTAGDAVPGPGSAPAGARATTGWIAEVAADRAYFDKVVAQGGADAGTLQFPAYCPRRQFRLTRPEVRIGRRSAQRGIEPEIDLTGPPADPGVSRMHAVLIPEPDGSLAIIDPGSENGTIVNGSEIPVGVKVPLAEGDSIQLGAWTVITIRAADV